nr:LOW QUALITY PROTEIN: uncharacterized protein LOC106145842 [Columba livia]
MRRAMACAIVGDDDYGEDPTVNELQRLAAGILGMEEALFVPTATMANLIAGECRGCAQPSFLHPRGAGHKPRDSFMSPSHGGCRGRGQSHCPALPRGETRLRSGGCPGSCRGELRAAVQPDTGASPWPPPPPIWSSTPPLSPWSAPRGSLPAQLLLCLPQVRGLADRYGLQVHMDGARLMNAAVAQGVKPAQITQYCDSVSLCFSKVCSYGEGSRVQMGPEKLGPCPCSGASGPCGLGHPWARPQEGRGQLGNARRFAEGIRELNSPLCSISLAAVETNIVMMNTGGGWLSPQRKKLCEHLRAVSEEEVAETGQAVSVLVFPWSAHTVRATWHRDVTAHDTELAKNKLAFVARKWQEKLDLGLRPTPPGAGGA